MLYCFKPGRNSVGFNRVVLLGTKKSHFFYLVILFCSYCILSKASVVTFVYFVAKTGLLVAYCHRFDVWNNNSTKIYYISCTIGTISTQYTPLPILVQNYPCVLGVDGGNGRFRKIDDLLDLLVCTIH